jgi:hypothetical protein
MASSEKGLRPHSMTVTVSAILCWYAANVALLLVNKFLLSSSNFRQPVFLTLCHMATCLAMGLLISASGYTPMKPLKSRSQAGKIVFLTFIFCCTVVSDGEAVATGIQGPLRP